MKRRAPSESAQRKVQKAKYDMSVSSAERQKRSRQPTRPGRTRGVHPTMDSRSRPHETKAAELPKVDKKLFKIVDATAEPIARMIEKFPYMKTDTFNPEFCTTAEGKQIRCTYPSKRFASLDDGDDSSVDDEALWSRETPHCDIHTSLFKYVQRLPQIMLGEAMTSGEPRARRVQDIRDRRIQLPTVTAVHESALLGEAGRFPFGNAHVQWPACHMGDECMGKKIMKSAEKPDGIVLTQWMTVAEMERLVYHGVLPPSYENRTCVLCLRHNMQMTYYLMRNNYGKLRKIDPNRLVQPYRVPVDEANGYHKRFCIVPSPLDPPEVWCGIAEPFPQVCRALLSLVIDPLQGGRCMVDQSAIRFTAPRHPATNMASGYKPQRLSSFRERSMALGGLAGGVRRSLMEGLERANQPRLTILREFGSHPTLTKHGLAHSTLFFPSELIVTNDSMHTEVVRRLRAAYRDSGDTPELTHWLALAIDDMDLEIRALHRPVMEDPDACSGYARPHLRLNPALSEHLANHFMNTPLYAHHTEKEDNRLTDLLAKGHPQPCVIRKFRDVALATYKSAHLRRIICTLMALTLAGSYPHTPLKNRPTLEQRRFILRQLARPDDRPSLNLASLSQTNDQGDLSWFFLPVLKRVPWILLVGIQDHMAWVTRSQPAIWDLMSRQFCWSGFCETLEKNLGPIRRRFMAKLFETDTKSVWQLSAPDVKLLNMDLETNKNMLVPMGHQRPRLPLWMTFPSHKLVDKNQKWINEEDPVEGFTSEKAEFLRNWASRVPVEEDPIVSQVPKMVDMGVSGHCIKVFLATKNAWDRPTHRMGDKQGRDVLDSIFAQWPYSYRVIQYFCRQVAVFRDSMSRRLPLHYLQNQMEALYKNHAFEGKLPPYATTFVFCSVCNTPYSMGCSAKPVKHVMRDGYRSAQLLKDAISARAGRNQRKRTLMTEIPGRPDEREVHKMPMGFKNMYIDIFNGDWTCSNMVRQMAGTSCQRQTLTGLETPGRLLIMGNMRKVVLNCCECGSVMCYDNITCRISDRGMCCPRCTLKYRLSAEEEYMVLPYMTKKHPGACVVCGHSITDDKNSQAVVLQHGMLLCFKHATWNNGSLVKAAQTWICQTDNEVALHIATHVAEVRAIRQSMRAAKDKKALALAKRRRRDPKFGQ